MTHIYISPSNQSANRYAFGGTNEQEQMERVAHALVRELGRYECKATLATLTKNPLTGGANGRPAEAAHLNADVYLALHSNATAKGAPSDATGFQAYTCPQTHALGFALTGALEELYRVPTNAGGVFNGLTAFNGMGYAEVREPLRHGVPGLLLEIGFHDNPLDARWIMDNTAYIANAIAKGLSKHYSLVLKPVTAPNPPKEVIPGTGPLLFRVQVGAFRTQDFARGYQKRLKDSFKLDTWIATEQASGAPLYRVIAGSFSYMENAMSYADRLRSDLDLAVYVYEVQRQAV